MMKKNAFDRQWADGKINEVEDIICREFRIDRSLIGSDSKCSEIKYTRWIIWYIMKGYGYRYQDMQNRWGRKFDHTTIMNALGKLPVDVNHYQFVRNAYIAVMNWDQRTLLINWDVPCLVQYNRRSRAMKAILRTKGVMIP